MLVQLIQLPFDSGHAGARMGRGPGHLLAHGALDRLLAAGHRVEAIRVEPRTRFPTEISTAFELSGRLAHQVRMAANQKRFPLILAGNCFSAVGTLAGLARGGPVGVIWMDAHGDLHTPESTRSGMLDGMALATAMGLCWRALAADVPGFRPLPPEHLLLVGQRDLDPAERELRERLMIPLVAPGGSSADAELEAALDALRQRVERVYLHLDLDVLDPDAAAPANAFAAPGGLSPERLLETIDKIRQRFRVSAAALAAYDPALDRDNRVARTALAVMEALTV